MNDPVSAGDEQPTALVADEAEKAVRKRDLAASFAKEAAVVLGVTSAKVASRTVSWSVTGLALGVLICGVWAVTGALPTPWWGTLTLILLTLVLAVGGFGYVGWFRGLGRAAIYVGCERGMVTYLVGAILDRVTALVRKSTRASSALDKGEALVGNLPLQVWEDRLKQVVLRYLDEPDLEQGGMPGNTARFTRFLRRFLVLRIERYLLAIVRKEAGADGSGGGVSVERVRMVALNKVDAFVQDLVEGMMFNHLGIGLLATLVFFIIPFVCAYAFQW